MELVNAVINGYLTFFHIFVSLISSPLKHPDLLWTLAPVYVSWLLTETFHQFEEDDIIMNANTCFWIAMDWGRQSYYYYLHDYPYATLGFTATAIMLLYGGILVYLFLHDKRDWLTKFLARSREISFLQIVLTPVVYYPQEYIQLLGGNLISATITLVLIFFGFIPLAHIFGMLLGFVGKKLFGNLIANTY